MSQDPPQLSKTRRSSAAELTGRWTSNVALATAVGMAYFLAAQLSNSFLITPETVIFWPAAGISTGLLISLWSIARWPVVAGVMLATATANFLRNFGTEVTAVWVIGNTAEPLIIAGLVRYYFGSHFKIDRLYCVLGLFAAAIAGTAVASTWWTFAYYGLFASLNDPTATWLHWIVSDFAGIVSVAPLVIGITATLRQPPPWREVVEGIAPIALLGAMTGVIILLPPTPWQTVLPAALVFPMLLWLAARSPPVWAAAGASIVSVTVALTSIYGLGHFGDSSLSIDARVLQAEAIILVVSVGTSILAALFAERRESEARLAQSNMLLQRERDSKLMNAEATSAAIAHELKQPLAAMVANADASLEFLEQTPPNLVQAKEALSDIVADGHHAGDALDGVRTLFKNVKEAREPIDVNELASEVLHSMRNELISHSITLQSEFAPEIPLVEGNRGQLQQVIFNLAHNAVEAMAEMNGHSRLLRLATQRDDRDRIVVVVHDTGPGIDPKRLNEIFDAFMTTKAHGTGLGLAICRVIVERHGGELTVFSDGRNGALFQFSLPVAPAAGSDKFPI